MYNLNTMTSITVKPKKRGRPATGKDPLVGFRAPAEIREAIERFRETESDDPSQSEAIRRIVRFWLISNAFTTPAELNEIEDVPIRRPNLTREEDEAINAYYASGEPGIGAHFMRAMINHMRGEMRRKPDMTVEYVKEFVLDMFDDYGQSLETPPEI